MPRLSNHIKSALYWFIEDLVKCQFENERWDFDDDRFGTGELNYEEYLKVLTCPSGIKGAISIWSNNLEIDENGIVLNEDYAAFRAFQWLRSDFDPSFDDKDIQPPFEDWELEEHETYD